MHGEALTSRSIRRRNQCCMAPLLYKASLALILSFTGVTLHLEVDPPGPNGKRSRRHTLIAISGRLSQERRSNEG